MTVVQEVSPPPTPESRAIFTSLVDMDRKIKHELAHSTFIEVPNLIESVFDGQEIDKTVSRIYKRLKKDGTYITSKETGDHWANLHQQPQSENALYEPLVDILNAIAKQVQKPRMPLIWVDRHNHAIQSDYLDRLIPDIVALCLPQDTDVEEYLAECAKQPRYEVWWRLVQTPLEVKKDVAAGKSKSSIIQLFKYGRQTLKEQPDRRFVFALLFTRDKLGFWSLDRSGALGSQVFDVHTEPEKLIRVVAGLMLKKPSDLGWDPTMEQFLVDEGRFHRTASYEIPRTMKAKFHVAHERKWVVKMPKPMPKPKPRSEHQSEPELIPDATPEPTVETEDFILFRAVSLSHAEVIRGRSTRIWLAWLASEMSLEEKTRQVFVFKDCWRDSRRPHEGKLYEIGCKDDDGEPVEVGGVAKVHSYGTVRVDGQEDNTEILIRKGIKPMTEPIVLYDDLSWVESYWRDGRDTAEVPEMEKEAIRRFFVESDLADDERDIPQNRIHSRLVLSSFGWPLLKFKSLPELFGALLDVVAGHKHLCRRGVLHRDVSPGNILITGQKSPNSGILIDLDYGIQEPRENPPLISDPLTGTIHFMSGELLNGERYEFPSPSDLMKNTSRSGSTSLMSTQDETLAPAVRLDYIDDDVEQCPPDVTVDEIVRHADHHDVEALFWTLCYVCIAREGPGKARVTWPDDATQYQAVLGTLEDVFYAEDPSKLAITKRNLIVNAKDFRKKIIGCFSPYFEPCKKIVTWFYHLLHLAYLERNFEGLHDAIITAFTKRLQSAEVRKWHSLHPEYQQMEEEEEKRREEDKKGKFDSPHKIDTKALSKRNTRKKRGQEDLPEHEEAGTSTSKPHQPRTKRAKRIPRDDPPSSPSARAASKAKSRSTKGQSSSTTQGHDLRSKTRTSSQSLATKNSRRTRKK